VSFCVSVSVSLKCEAWQQERGTGVSRLLCVHARSVHKCCCRECAQALKNTRNPTCPMCRAPIEHFIMNFY
jgi:hypothetical protein